MKNLSAWILEDLKKSGLTPEDFPVIPLENERQLYNILGFTMIGNTRILDVGGYFIPYPNVKNYYRFKLRYPIEGTKYLAPKNSSNHPYISNAVYEILKKQERALGVTEKIEEKPKR